MTPQEVAPDDIVATDGEAGARPPLIVVERLLPFLDAHGLGEGEPTFAPLGDGHSNVTYLIERGPARFVLRRPPRPPIPPSANDMLRETTVLRALTGRTRVPRVLAVCEDDAVIGAPFYVMEEIEGVVVAGRVPPALDSLGDRRRMCEEVVDALVELHAVDWRAAGLESFGKPHGYLERQLRRFSSLWEHNRTRERPMVDQVAEWLWSALPASPSSTIVHGDYRLGNVMLAPNPPAQVTAILDWEMSTIGDPLADLGYLSALWVEADDPSMGLFESSAVTRQEGFLGRSQILARYEERSGRRVTGIRWYQVFALWKAAIFMEGNYRRTLLGMSDDPYLKSFAEEVDVLARRAHDLASGASGFAGQRPA